MSYILDALNKAEQTRKQSQHPTTQTYTEHEATPPSNPQSFSRNKLILWLGLVLFIMLWAYQSLPMKPAAQTQQPVTLQNPEHHAIDISPTPPQPATHLKAMKATQSVNPPAVKIEAKPITKHQTKSIPNIRALPQNILNELPTLTMSAHTFSTTKNRRMVIINDVVLHENQYIDQHLLLKSITQYGVEIEYQDTLFSMVAMDNWSP
jgi:hypothetical protein